MRGSDLANNSPAPKERLLCPTGCTFCCQNLPAGAPLTGSDLDRLEDFAGLYQLEHWGEYSLRLNPDRSCSALGDSGCTIYPKRPLACRGFDCRPYPYLSILRKRDGFPEPKPLHD